MAWLRVLRPSASIAGTLALVVLVVADRVGMSLRPLHLGPREWALLLFPAQVVSFTLARAFRVGGKARRAKARSVALPPGARFTNLQFAELCALVLTLGYWVMTDARLDGILRPGWRVLAMGLLLLIPVMAKLVSERTED